MAKGFVVVALTGTLGAFVAQSTAVASSERTAMREARAAVADAAFDAMQTAQLAEAAAQDVTLDDASVEALEAATSELEALLDEAGAAELLAGSGVADLRGAPTVSRSGSRAADDRASSGAAGADATSADATGTTSERAGSGAPQDAAPADATPTAGASAPAEDGGDGGDAGKSAVGPSVAPSPGPLLSASDDLLSQVTEPGLTSATTPPAGSAPTADAAPAGPAAPADDTADAASGTAASSDAASSDAGSSDAASSDAGSSDATAAEDAPADADAEARTTAPAVEVPPVAGPEDATTQKLRRALARVVALSGEVFETAEEERARIAAEEEAARIKAEQEAAAAAAAAAAEKKAQEEAAAKAAAEAAAAERAAWKKSLLGYANGRIPASALCALTFEPGHMLRCDAAEDLEALDAAYLADFGRHLDISDSYRSYGAQVTCRATKGWLCAQPGTSNHGTGIAVDLGGGIQSFGTAQHRWMQEHADEFGWTHPAWARAGGSKPEAWHWEYTR